MADFISQFAFEPLHEKTINLVLVSDQVRHKPDCSEISDLERKYFVHSMGPKQRRSSVPLFSPMHVVWFLVRRLILLNKNNC